MRDVAVDKKIAGLVVAGFALLFWCILIQFPRLFWCCILCIFMQFLKKLVFSTVAAICKFGIIIILPNNS